MKKLLSLVVVLALVIGMMPVASAATEIDYADNMYAESIDKMFDLGVTDGYSETDQIFMPDNTLTRAEAIKFILTLTGELELVNLYEGQPSGYTDVPVDAWYSPYVALATVKGITNGYGDGNFGPNDPVKYFEMCKFLVVAMNGNGIAEAKGGWPMGYYTVAEEDGITEDIVFAGTANITRAIVAKMMDNSMTVAHFDVAEYDTNGVGTWVKTDADGVAGNTVTFLTKMGFEGKVVEVNTVPVTKNADEDAKINSYDLVDASVATDVLPGQTVTLWLNEDDEVVSATPAEDTVVLYDYTNDAEWKIDGSSQEVTIDGDDYTLKTTGSAVVYSGAGNQTAPAVDEKQFIADGYVAKIVVEDDEIVAVYTIDVTSPMIVEDTVDEKNNLDTTNGIVDLDGYYDDENQHVLDMMLNTVDPADIAVDAVVYAVNLGLDNDVIFVADANVVAGEVTDYDTNKDTVTDTHDGEIYVDGTSYDVSDYATEVKDADLAGFLDDEVEVVLDITGQVVDVRVVTESDTTSGDLYGVALDFNPGNFVSGLAGTDSKVEIFTQDGEKVVYTFANETETTADADIDTAKEFKANYTAKMFVKYTLDDEEIATVEVVTSNFTTAAAEFDADNGELGQIYVDDSAIIFVIDAAGDYDRVVTMSDLMDGKDYVYAPFGNANEPKALVVEDDGTNFATDSIYAVVDGYERTNSDYDFANFYVNYDNDSVEFYAEDGKLLSKSKVAGYTNNLGLVKLSLDGEEVTNVDNSFLTSKDTVVEVVVTDTKSSAVYVTTTGALAAVGNFSATDITDSGSTNSIDDTDFETALDALAADADTKVSNEDDSIYMMLKNDKGTWKVDDVASFSDLEVGTVLRVVYNKDLEIIAAFIMFDDVTSK